MALSARSEKALSVLKNGGKFCHRLETDGYTGRNQFHYRLLNNNGHVVKGFGLAAFYELKNAGFLRLCDGNTSVSTYWEA